MITNSSPETKPVALIAGPTASGKSGLALQLADQLCTTGRDAIIINADSMQLYREIPVLSAAPDAAERALHPHRLYLEWEGTSPCSAADWADRAKEEIATAHDRGAVPILVGGTGMYIRTLLEGIAPIPAIDPAVREKVRAMPTADAYCALQAADPNRAARLDAGDSQRIARALEVVLSTGRTLADWQATKTGGIADRIDLHSLIVLPDREWLYERCDQRFEIMFDGGAVEEVAAMVARQLSQDLPVMRAIGLPEIAGFLSGELLKDEAIAAGQKATRRYAKRQYTWFGRQTPTEWQIRSSQDCAIERLFARLLRI